MSAPRDVQAKVASAIPLNRWAPTTVNAVLAKYPGIDTSQTLGPIPVGGDKPLRSLYDARQRPSGLCGHRTAGTGLRRPGGPIRRPP